MASRSLPESFLCAVWSRRLYRTEGLATAEGVPVDVLAPGQANTDAGPDFRGATIRIGEITYTGDVEIHLDERGWEAHEHDDDPAYNGVILHVVLEPHPGARPAKTAARRPIPLLILRPFLDPMLEAQAEQLLLEPAQPPPAPACAGRAHELDPACIASLLDHHGIERFELKLRRLQARLHQIAGELAAQGDAPHAALQSGRHAAALLSTVPWEQLLYEGIMEGMGYSKNRTPFLALARALPLRELLRISEGDPDAVEALLFGAAGLLHRIEELPGPSIRAHAGKLRALWMLLRQRWQGSPLAGTDWLFFRLRPANFPTARLACMAGLVPHLFGDGSFRRLIATVSNPLLSPSDRLHGLRAMIALPPGPTTSPLGTDRVTELIINTVVPVLLLYARTYQETGLRVNTIDMLRLLPAGQPNSFTLPLEHAFPRSGKLFATALRQQGAINLYKHSCLPRRCAECDVGVRLGLGGGPA